MGQRHVSAIRASQHQVLDLCCGSGVAALHALRCGAKTCVAVDLSDRACAVAKAWLSAVGGYGFMSFHVFLLVKQLCSSFAP